MLRPLLTTRMRPYRSRKIPEIHRRAIRNEKGLPVDLFMVQGFDVGFRGCKERKRCEEMRVGDVYDVGEVKEVGVVTKLETSAVRVMHIEDRGQDLHVAFAKDAGGPEGAG